MPAQLALLTFIGGLIVVLGCIFYPREIGKEAEPIVEVGRVDLPSVEELAAKLRQFRQRHAPAATTSTVPRAFTPAPRVEPAASMAVTSEQGVASVPRVPLEQPAIVEDTPGPPELPPGSPQAA